MGGDGAAALPALRAARRRAVRDPARRRRLGRADEHRRVPPVEQPPGRHREARRVAHRPRPDARRAVLPRAPSGPGRRTRSSTSSAPRGGRRRAAVTGCTSTCASAPTTASAMSAAPPWPSPERSSAGCRTTSRRRGGAATETLPPSSSTTTRTRGTTPSPLPTRCGATTSARCRHRSDGTRSTTWSRRTSPSPPCRSGSRSSATCTRESTRRSSTSVPPRLGRARRGRGGRGATGARGRHRPPLMDLVVRPGPGVPQGLTVPGGELVERFSRSSGPVVRGSTRQTAASRSSWTCCSVPGLSTTQRARVVQCPREPARRRTAPRRGRVRAPPAAPQPGGGPRPDGRAAARCDGPAAAAAPGDEADPRLPRAAPRCEAPPRRDQGPPVATRDRGLITARCRPARHAPPAVGGLEGCPVALRRRAPEGQLTIPRPRCLRRQPLRRPPRPSASDEPDHLLGAPPREGHAGTAVAVVGHDDPAARPRPCRRRTAGATGRSPTRLPSTSAARRVRARLPAPGRRSPRAPRHPARCPTSRARPCHRRRPTGGAAPHRPTRRVRVVDQPASQPGVGSATRPDPVTESARGRRRARRTGVRRRPRRRHPPRPPDRRPSPASNCTPAAAQRPSSQAGTPAW